MSRLGIHTSMMIGGELTLTSVVGQFAVRVTSPVVDPLTIHLTRDEAAQWAAVLSEFAGAK